MRSVCNMQRVCRGRKGALILIEHVLQGGKGSTVGMRGRFVGNWTKDPRGNCYASYLSGRSLQENIAQKLHHRNDPQKMPMLTFIFLTDVMPHKKNGGCRARPSRFFCFYVSSISLLN